MIRGWALPLSLTRGLHLCPQEFNSSSHLKNQHAHEDRVKRYLGIMTGTKGKTRKAIHRFRSKLRLQDAAGLAIIDKKSIKGKE